MNICIIAPRYPYKENMEYVFVKKLIDEWAKMGHHCTVITCFSTSAYRRGRISYRPQYYREEASPGNNVDIYCPRFISLGLNICGVSLNLWSSMRAIEKLMNQFDTHFDCIYCHFFSSSLLVYRYANRNSIPLFVATGESTVELLRKPYLGFNWSDYRKFTKGVVAVATKNKTEASELGMIDPIKCKVFPNGTNIQVFKPLDKSECRRRLSLPDDSFIISCVGTICERKGQNRLLEAVRRIEDNNVKLLFLGPEPKVGSSSVEGEEILFKGLVDNQDLPIYLCASDVFCLPTRAEGCCNAIIEAMACGLPIISSNMPFNWDVLDDSNSILVNSENIDDIAGALSLLKSNLSRRAFLAKGALNKAKELTIEQRADNIMRFIYEQI